MKKLISLILVFLIFIPTVYASGSTPATSNDILVLLMDLTNILWLPFAFIAGQLLTNDFVYGTFLGVDKVLWNIWNISRIAAMSILGAMFFRFIVMTFFSKEQGTKALKKLPKVIIAALLINISFFFLGALIDISSVLIGVAGQLPQTIVSDDTNNKRDIRVCNKFKIVGKMQGETKEFLECIKRTEGVKIKDYLDGIANSSGLLVYLASSVLHIEQLSNIPGGESMSLKSMTTATAIKVITSILFIIPLVILIIINIIRIFRIWIYVAFAPLIALDIVFGSKIGSKMTKNQAFSLANIIGMIFQPVLVVAALSLVVIFMTMLQITFQNSNSKGLKELQAEMDPNQNSIKMTYGENNKNLLTINGNLGIRDSVQNGFGQIIISLIGVLLMWGVIKASFKFSEVTKSVSSGMFEFGENIAKATPIVGGVGYGAMKMALDKKVLKRGFTGTASTQASPITDFIDKTLGIDGGDIKMDRRVKYMGKLKYAKSIKGKLEILEELMGEAIETNVTPTVSPNFKLVFKTILEQLKDINPDFKQFFRGKYKDGVDNRDEYLSNPHNPGTGLIMGMYAEYERTGKLPDITNITSFSNLIPYIKKGAGGNVNIPFESKNKKNH